MLKELVVSQIIEYGDSIEEVVEEWNIPKYAISLWLRKYRKKQKEEAEKESQKPDPPLENSSLEIQPKIDNQQTQRQSNNHNYNKDEKDEEWISTRMESNSRYTKAVEKVLEGYYEEDVANEFDIHLELLKLRVRQQRLKQIRTNLLQNNQ